MSDKIFINNMKFYAYHGVLPEEKKLGQNFYIDLELYKDLKMAGETDNLNYTVDYSKIYEDVRDIVTKQNFDLIESIAESIARILLEKYPVKKVVIRIRKPSAPIEGNFDCVGIEIMRESNEKI